MKNMKENFKNRISAYQDFRAMDTTPEIAAALTIIRDKILTRFEREGILEVFSENLRVKEVLNDLFKNVLNVDFNLGLLVRDLVKYGDYFVLLDVDKDVGVCDFLTLPIEEVHREEAYDGRIDSVRFKWVTTGEYFEEWQVAHFRLLEDVRKLPYGTSVLHEIAKNFKTLKDAEKVQNEEKLKHLVKNADLDSIIESVVLELKRIAFIHLNFLEFDIKDDMFELKFGKGL